LETYYLKTANRLYHGEAIAAGMIAESEIALQLALISATEEKSIRTYITSVFGTISVSEPMSVLKLMRQDKKNRDNRILMALPKGIGNAVWDIEVSEEMAMEAIKRLGSQ
jgi:3-dehydroquinate synthase